MTSPVMWRKSSKSGPERSECIEVAELTPGTIGIRDSKNSIGPHLAITPAAFARLVQAIKNQ